MTLAIRLVIFGMALVAGIGLLSCQDEGDTTFEEADDDTADDDSADDDAGDDDSGDDDATDCTVDEYCQDMIDCGAAWASVSECAAAQDTLIASCSDGTDLVNCICACFEENECDPAMTCAMQCSLDHCE